ncbi:MAG: pilus motility taxis protein HmpF [Calothrix sp. MO_167.B12]|nr:pilus motility taxis protein HmpF [Calothrix sp. MO_167.B12]
MLYLAEIQKPKIGGLLSGVGKTELKLMACQRTDHSWNPVNDEVITTDEAGKLQDGALVLVEMNGNRQVQRLQEAGRPLVNILQNLSRQLEKLKLKEEEINQWKESLTFQAEEFNNRELEMEARWEQLQQIEDEFQRLETEKQEFETTRQEIEKLQSEIKREREELEGAWEHLRGEQARLQESQEELQTGKVLDEEQSRQLRELIDRLSGSVASVEPVREHLNLALEMVESQQEILNPHWEQFQSQKTLVEQQQAAVEELAQNYSQQQQEWEEVQTNLLQQQADLQANTAVIESKQAYIQSLREHLQRQEDLYQYIQSLAVMAGDVVLSDKVDMAALENMPVEELQQKIQDSQEKLKIDSSFVNDQEQELTYKLKEIAELKTKISQASGEEKTQLEAVLADEKDAYQFLNESLVGQRRSLLDLESYLRQYQAVLWQRQGNSLMNLPEEQKIDLKPALKQIDTYKQQKLAELQSIERELEDIDTGFELAQNMIDNRIQEQETKRQEIKSLEQDLLERRQVADESLGKLNIYQEALQPIQDALDGLRYKLQELSKSLVTVQETGESQQQTINEMNQQLMTVIAQPELAVS